MNLGPALKRKLFMVLIGISAINMIPFTREFIVKFVDYSLGPITIGTVFWAVLLYGLKMYYDRDLIKKFRKVKK